VTALGTAALLAGALGLAPALALAGPEPVPAAPADAAAFLAARAAPVVNVRALLAMRMSMGGQSGEREVEAHGLGTIVDPSGLVVLSADVLGDVGQSGDMLRQMDISLTVEPKEVNVVVGGDGRERAALIVARDSVLGLAYVHVLGDEGKPFPAADLRPGAEPKIGERLLAVGRKTEAFDRAPLLLRCYASQRLERPRRMWAVTGDHEASGLGSISLGFLSGTQFVGGTPAYDVAGRAVGLLSRQVAVGGESVEDTAQVDALLPLDVVARSIDAAKRVLPAALEKAAAASGAAAGD
jgi:hypothetical protein